MRDHEFEWDDAKPARNAQAHAVTFEMAREALCDPFVVEWADDGQGTSEDRFAALGMADNRLMYVAYTIRGERTRIISARYAEPFERRKYFNENKA
jgi:uncharacterized DUF497 family protein